MTASALYFGVVEHRRLRPRRHDLRYRVFSLLLDLDELPALQRGLRLLSYNRWNLLSFRDRDHGDGSGAPLRGFVEAQLTRAGIDTAGGAIQLLCFPRMLGYVFNPLSVYFCHHRDGTLRAILYEVSNTFGERHSYLLPVIAPADGPIRQGVDKAFYVSPFMAMAGHYGFTITPPGDGVAVRIRQSDAEGVLLYASLVGERAELTDAALAGAFLRYPLMTLKVMAGIHWEALKLWRKGLKLVPRPAPPSESVTISRGLDPDLDGSIR